jgi:phage baseplate assembly protein W
MPTMDLLVNNSVVNDVASSINATVDSFVNSSTVDQIGIGFINAIDSVINTSTINSVSTILGIRPDGHTNTNSINPISVTQTFRLFPTAFDNTSVVNDIRRLGIIGFDAFANQSVVNDFAASYTVNFAPTLIQSSSIISDVQVYLNENVIVPFVPVKRPVKTISNTNTGFKKFVFKDIALKGGSHPLTGDLLAVTDFNAVSQSIRNIVLTNKTERFFDDIDFGVGVESYLFELNTPDLQDRIREDIVSQIAKYEPRAIIVDVVVNATPFKHQMSIQIFFKIKTTTVTDSVTILLERR